MKGLKRFLAVVLAAVIITGLAAPVQSEAAAIPKIKKVKLYEIYPEDNCAFLQVTTSGTGKTQKYEYKVYVNGKPKKKGTSGVARIGKKEYCEVRLPAYTACTVRVRAKRGGKWSKWSGYTAVVPPVKMRRNTISGSIVTLRWKKMTGATNYVVYIKNESSGKLKKAAVCKGTTVMINISGYGKDFFSDYSFRIIARKKLGGKYIGSM